MNLISRYVARNESLKKALSSSSLVKRIAQRFVLTENLEESNLIGKWYDQGFGVILYPIEADAQNYLEALTFWSEKPVAGSVSLRAPFEDLNLVVEEAAKKGVRLEFDMRAAKEVDQTLQLYSEIKRKHSDSVICLQANLYRTATDIEDLHDLSPIVRLVKGAFKSERSYRCREEIDLNYIRLAKMLINRDVKTYLATHDEKIIKELISFSEERGIGRDQFGFQMLHGVRSTLQEELRKDGYEVWKYLAYGEDWVPYCINRLLERKENISFALEAILKE